MQNRVFIVFCSPGGSTGLVAQTMEKTFSSLPVKLFYLDLRSERELSWFWPVMKKAGKNDCLFIGSPVYGDAAVSPIMGFIEAMPKVLESYAVPFVTWGGVTSGIALWQMGRALQDKGFMIAGAAKVLAVHSLMWQCDQPVGRGHPDSEDHKAIEQLVTAVYDGLVKENLAPYPLESLDYQLAEHGAEMKNKLHEPRPNIPKEIDETRCNQCGRCLAICPAFAISMAPYPAIDNRCFDCLSCVRICPEEAITAAIDPKKIEEHIRMRINKFNEPQATQVFFQP